MNPRKIVLTGGPSTGKSSVVSELKSRSFVCYDEISRQVTLQAQKDGIEQLFLKEPLLFSEKLLEGRVEQFINASNEKTQVVFLDRGIPDVLAYMDYIDDDYPRSFKDACIKYTYDTVFVFEPWEAIYKTDNERYENFEQATKIHQHLISTYQRFGYNLITVPFLTIAQRANFILDALDL